MIIAIKTESMTAELYLLDSKGDEAGKDIWEAGRSLAKDLLARLDTLVDRNNSWEDVEKVIVFKGPGSFTSLRIGITTANTIAYARGVPIVGTDGEDWLRAGLERLAAGENDQVVLPLYGADPHITAPKK